MARAIGGGIPPRRRSPRVFSATIPDTRPTALSCLSFIQSPCCNEGKAGSDASGTRLYQPNCVAEPSFQLRSRSWEKLALVICHRNNIESDDGLRSQDKPGARLCTVHLASFVKKRTGRPSRVEVRRSAATSARILWDVCIIITSRTHWVQLPSSARRRRPRGPPDLVPRSPHPLEAPSRLRSVLTQTRSAFLARSRRPGLICAPCVRAVRLKYEFFQRCSIEGGALHGFC